MIKLSLLGFSLTDQVDPEVSFGSTWSVTSGSTWSVTFGSTWSVRGKIKILLIIQDI